MKTFAQAENFLAQFYSSRWTYTLGRMQQLVAEIGHPEQKIPIIHIGGTAGKGSTSYITASILEKAGYKVGLHTSPHLVSIMERFMINRTPISEKKFIQLLNDMLPAIDIVAKTNPDGAPTYYEITVAMMFKNFFEERVDLAVVEVGLGGKLDGTNVLTPQVSVITNVGLDHTDILGNTVEKIILDKREIIKPGKPVVSAATQETVRSLIIEKAASVHSPLFLIDRDFFVKNIVVDHGITFDFVSKNLSIKNLHISLLGRHQAINAAVAIMAVNNSGFKVSQTAIRNALSSVEYSGRLEVTKIKNAPVIIDGAHNPMKMAALAQALDDHFPGQKFPTLFAVKNDKNVSEMITILAPYVSHWYVTTLNRVTDWGKSVMFETKDLAPIVAGTDPNKPLTIVENFPEFLSNLSTNEPLLITGSLYLIGAVEEWRRNQNF